MLGARFGKRCLHKVGAGEARADLRCDGLGARPGIAAGIDIEFADPGREELLLESSDRERGDADFKTVRGSFAQVLVMLHIPEVTELMLGAGRGPAGL